MLSRALFLLLLACVLSQKCKRNEGEEKTNTGNHTKCLYCSYNISVAAKPELLWATSGTAFLRARVCGCWCRDKTYWFYQNIKMNGNTSYTEGPAVTWSLCNTKEYCEITGSPGSRMLISFTFFNYKTGVTNPPSVDTYVRLCPDEPPPRPRSVTCRKLGNRPQLRWIYKYELEDLKCFSYTQFVVFTEGVRGWRWLGEASPTLSSFGGLVHRCPDNPDFLCANLSITYGPKFVKLGARRIDADEESEVNTTEYVQCAEFRDTPTLPWQTTDHSNRVPALDPPTTTFPVHVPLQTSPPAPPALVPNPVPAVECPQPSPVPSDPPTSGSLLPDSNSRPWKGRPHHAPCEGLNTITLVALVALLVCVALLPLAFLAGRRSRTKKQLGVSWQQLGEDRSERNGMHGSSTTVFGERPPQYEYDYAGLLPLRSPLPPPLPALPPPPLPQAQPPPLPTVPPPGLPPPEEHYKEVNNDIYHSVE